MKILTTIPQGSAFSLFLDDERSLHHVTWVSLPITRPWLIVRNFEEFKSAISTYGIPEFISWDHDLGPASMAHGAKTLWQEFDYSQVNEKTGMDCAKWLVEYCLDNNLKLPQYEVHSMNPCGAQNIRGLLDNFVATQTKNS